MTRFLIALLTSAGSMALLPGCAHNGRQTEGTTLDSVPKQVRPIVEAIVRDDSLAFAGLVDYPLGRPYPLPDIASAEEMRSYYPVLVDDSLKMVLTSGKTPWHEEGWRGWTAGNGEYIRVDSLIYEVPYVSAMERVRLEKLRQEELATLPEGMREGWEPAGCLRDLEDESVYRIDRKKGSDKDTGYRLAVYRKGTDLRARPDLLLNGKMHEEGTMGLRSYQFTDSQGIQAKFNEDMPDGSPSTITFAGNGEETTHEVEKKYWLELL